MKSKKTLFFALATSLVGLFLICLVSAFVGYQYGYSWGRRAEQRSALRLPGVVDVYGCGVDRFVRIDASSQVPMHQFLDGLQPLPPEVNAAFIETAHGGRQYCKLSELLSTNGVGSLPLVGGERVVLVHAFK